MYVWHRISMHISPVKHAPRWRAITLVYPNLPRQRPRAGWVSRRSRLLRSRHRRRPRLRHSRRTARCTDRQAAHPTTVASAPAAMVVVVLLRAHGGKRPRPRWMRQYRGWRAAVVRAGCGRAIVHVERGMTVACVWGAVCWVQYVGWSPIL